MHARIENNQVVEYPILNLRQRLPNVSLPTDLTVDAGLPSGFVFVHNAPPPSFNVNTHKATRNEAPSFNAGRWEIGYTITPLSQAEIDDALFAAKASKNAEINSWRLAANRGTFTHLGKTFACDELSRSDIDGVTSFVTLAGSLPPGWPGGWKATDNTYMQIANVTEWAAFVGSMVSAGNANFGRAQHLKSQLAAATTVGQVAAIYW